MERFQMRKFLLVLSAIFVGVVSGPLSAETAYRSPSAAPQVGHLRDIGPNENNIATSPDLDQKLSFRLPAPPFVTSTLYSPVRRLLVQQCSPAGSVCGMAFSPCCPGLICPANKITAFCMSWSRESCIAEADSDRDRCIRANTVADPSPDLERRGRALRAQCVLNHDETVRRCSSLP
jgi:hypothetical protein